jgi:molecular chaperone HtpG
MMLRGVVDADIPLNVSRSGLQADGAVKKISNYITRKVADKLKSLLKTVLTLKQNGMTLKSF